MKKILSLLLVLCLVVSLAACGKDEVKTADPAVVDPVVDPAVDPAEPQVDPAEPQTEGDTILIGGLAPLTGDVSQYGIAANNGAKLAVKEINAAGGILGKQIEYIVEDEQGKQEEAVNAYNKLVHNDKVVAIVGDITTKPTMAVAQLAARENMPIITPTATGEAVTTYGKNVFRACFIDPYQGELMANYAFEKLSAKSVAIIFDNGDDYSSGIAEAFKTTAEELGMDVVYYEGYNSGIEDFSAQLTKMKTENPDVVMVPTYYEDASSIITQARGMGIDVPLLGADGWDGVSLKIDPNKLDVLANTYYCSQYSRQSEDPKLQKFLADYKTEYGLEENMFAVLGYDAMNLLAASIEQAGSTDPDAIVEALTNLTHEGLTGTTRFDENRNPVREAYITEFVAGESVVKETYSFQ